ncbi:MAG: type II toxin-antitoxin system prevent-host-death family antitoxin [Alphaproteobacteria bacterium]|nr:type II toxin-antitoxin system prevent-host-death family antitoxin [Alphaproteobacteria bacterium]
MTEKVLVTASEFHRSFGALSDRALKEPISITKQGRDHLVLMSAEEYARLKRGPRVGLAEDLPEPMLQLVKRSRMHRRRKHLDAELKNWKP